MMQSSNSLTASDMLLLPQAVSAVTCSEKACVKVSMESGAIGERDSIEHLLPSTSDEGESNNEILTGDVETSLQVGLKGTQPCLTASSKFGSTLRIFSRMSSKGPGRLKSCSFKESAILCLSKDDCFPCRDASIFESRLKERKQVISNIVHVVPL